MARREKLGRNDPCYCGSGKKYKHCHLDADKEQARRERQTEESMPSFLREIESEIEEMENSPELEEMDAELQEANARWEQFETVDLGGKIELFTEALKAGKLDSEEAFEMLSSIREEMNITISSQARVRYAELVGQLRNEAPELYQQDAPYYHGNLIDDAITDMRWEAINELLQPFATDPENSIDIFFNIIDALMYYDQIQPLINVMGQALPKIMDSDDITPWGVNEFVNKFISLIFFNYIKSAENPNLDDPILRNAAAPYGDLNNEWLEKAIYHLTSPTAISWHEDDFGESVDAETLNNNLDCLLFDFMADQRNRSEIPFSRSEFVRNFLSSFLYEQMVAPPNSRLQERSSRVRRSNKRAFHSQSSTSYQSPLVPNGELLDQSLVNFFQILDIQIYKAGAVMELLPAYLHFLARLNLIHPKEMDTALEILIPIAYSAIDILKHSASEPHLVESVRDAWSDENLASFRDDPALAEARTKPMVERVSKPTKLERKPGVLQTYIFKAIYGYDEDVWRKIEISANQTLDDLHNAILDSVEFDHDHLYSFFLSGKAWDKSTEYSSPHADGRNAARIKIKDLYLRLKQKLMYIYDYGDEHRFKVQLIEINPDAPKDIRYPRITEEHGESPNQYNYWEDEDDEDWEYWEDE